MLDPKFRLPDRSLAQVETKKRESLIDWFSQEFSPLCEAILVSGSMAYGKNYSVTDKSDIDIQILLDPNNTDGLMHSPHFKKVDLANALSGFAQNNFSQFSLEFFREEVKMECHFWQEQAFFDAITYKTSTTSRLRSNIETPSTDFAYSFDREENKKDYFGEIIENFPVSDFPSYRRIENKLFLCRPITNILGNTKIIKTSNPLEEAIHQCWVTTVEELQDFIDSDNYNIEIEPSIINALPGKNKVSPQVQHWIQERTNEYIS